MKLVNHMDLLTSFKYRSYGAKLIIMRLTSQNYFAVLLSSSYSTFQILLNTMIKVLKITRKKGKYNIEKQIDYNK